MGGVLRLWGRNEQQEAMETACIRVFASYFFSSSNHDLKAVCFSTEQSYPIHKTRCFSSSFVRMTSSVGL